MMAASRPHFSKMRWPSALAAGLEDRQHPLLALRQHHLVGGHALFALGHHGRGRARCRRSPLPAISTDEEVRPAAPMSWMRGDGAGGHQLEASPRSAASRRRGRRPGRSGASRRCRRRTPARPWSRRGCRRGRSWSRSRPPAVPTPGGGRVEDLVGVGQADAHGVDQDVAVVAAVEVGLAGDGGHADAVAVAADAARPRPTPGACVFGCAGSPKRRAFSSAIGRAPMVNTSRMMPPTPVAAPW